MPRRRQPKPKPTPEELPPCDGSKLHLFKYHDAEIQWFERLGDNEDRGTPTEGYIFRASIRGREYAVKVFRFYDPMSTEYFWGPLMGDDTSLNTAAYYTDPFYAECRAYGRINEAVQKRKMKEDITVPCHGFLFLGERDEKILNDRKVDLELAKVDLAYQRQTAGGCRPRAIVKDIASANAGVGEKNLSKILRGIWALNRLRIYNMDIRLDNYRDGRIVDFGSSWTEPHALLDALGDTAAEDSKLADRVMFDQMVRDEGIPNPKGVFAMHHMELRSDSRRT